MYRIGRRKSRDTEYRLPDEAMVQRLENTEEASVIISEYFCGIAHEYAVRMMNRL